MQYHELIGYKLNSRVKASIESIAYYPFHLHKTDIEIIAVLNGAVTITDSALTHHLTYGNVYIFNPNIPHKVVSESSEDILLSIHIDTNHYRQFFKDIDAYFICDVFNTTEAYDMDIKYLRFLLARIYDLYTNEPKDHLMEDITKDLLQLLLENFQEYKYIKTESGSATLIRLQNTEHIHKNYNRMYKIVDYVIAHYRENLTLDKIAKMEFLSNAYLSRYIKETLGLTFSELVALTRCEDAERLLSATSMTVDQIASEVGFSSRQHLGTQFKRWFKRTPTEYRNEIQSDLMRTARINVRPYDNDFAQKILEMYRDQY